MFIRQWFMIHSIRQVISTLWLWILSTVFRVPTYSWMYKEKNTLDMVMENSIPWMVDTKYFSMHTKIAMSMSKVYALSTQTIANEIRHSCMFKYFILWMNCNINFRFQKNLVLCKKISISTLALDFLVFHIFTFWIL